jgi:hypothetical protein
MNVRELIISEGLLDVFLDQLCCFWEFLTAEFLDDCDDLGFRRLTARYNSRRPDDAVVRERMLMIARESRRFG